MRNVRTRIGLALVAFALAGAAAGCLGRQRPTSLRILVRDPIISLDPLNVDDRPTEAVLSNVYEALVRMEGGYVPALATSWSSPSDDVWRFELRRDVSFHDGRPFSARDAQYSIERGRRQVGASVAQHLASVESVSVVGSHSIEIRTRGPAPLLLNGLSRVGMTADGTIPDGAARAIGTGPYRVLAWERGGELRLGRVDSHWRRAAPWERVVIRTEEAGAARVSALRSGEVDLIDYPPEAALESLREGGRTRLIQRPAPRIAILGLLVVPRPGNPFSDPELRRAVSLGLDRRALIDGALAGWGTVPTQLAPRGVFGYLDGRPELSHEAAAARAAFADSGQPAGLRVPLAFDEQNRVIAEAIAEQLRPLGIDFDLAPIAWSELEPKMQRRELPAYVFHLSYYALDTWPVLYGGFHTRGDRVGSMNFSGYSDSEMDDLLQKARVAVDPGIRAGLLQRAMEKAMDADVWIPLCVRSFVWGARRGLSWEPSFSVDLELDQIHEES